MKTARKLFLFLPLLLAIMLGVTGCSNDDDNDVNPINEEENGILPIDVTGSPIAAFFNSEWPEPHYSSGGSRNSKSFFYDPVTYGGMPISENIVCVINSRQELADIYQGEKELPEIDFDKYTLILGQHRMPVLGFYVAKKELVEGDDGLTLNLHARHDARNDEILSTAIQLLCYWGIFPKQTQKNIPVNVIREFPNRK